ncbi:hypothetical protein, partial [Treponema saccharophilum]|uniref:hypothetical protein n=1 Tax=Treponema saccharophilum TaxID=165 RepID=UPI00386AEC0C
MADEQYPFHSVDYTESRGIKKRKEQNKTKKQSSAAKNATYYGIKNACLRFFLKCRAIIKNT